MSVFRVQNPGALALPGVKPLFLDALVSQKDKEGALQVFFQGISEPALGCFLGWDDEKGRPFGVGAVRLPQTVADPLPLVLFLCNRGSTPQRKELLGTMLQFCKGSGYNRVLMVNRGPHTDEALIRLYGPKGKKVASILELDFGE